MPKISTTKERDEWIKCANSFPYFCSTYLKVLDKKQGKDIPFELFFFQKELVQLYEDEDRILTNKYRQAGISTVTCAYIAWKICFSENVKVALVGNKVILAKKNLREIAMFIKNLPLFLQPDSEGDSSTKEYKTWKLGNEINEVQVQTASEDGIRGFTPNFIFIDEAAFLEFGKEFWDGSAAITSTGCKVIFVSTPNGEDPLFYNMYEQSIKGENNFKINIIKWYNDPRYNEDLKWIKGDKTIVEDDPQKRIKLEESGWKPTSTWYKNQCREYNNDKRIIAQELEGVFHGSGGNVIPDEVIKIHEENYVKDPIKEDSIYKNLHIWQDPIENYKYIMAIDVSSGEGDDFSTFIIWCPSTGEIVSEFREKISPSELGEISYKYAVLYNNAYVVVDITGSHGIPTVTTILDKGYTNVHYSEIGNRDYKKKLEKYKNKQGKRAGFVISSNRMLIINEFRNGLADETIKVSSVRLIKEIKNFVWKNGRPDHRRSSHDDLIIAVAMAVYVYNTDYIKQINDRKAYTQMVNNWVVVNQENYQEYSNNHEKIKHRSIDNNQSFLFF